jgi:ubiquinone/menaquinone biosynthesis C-methylase UbiE
LLLDVGCGNGKYLFRPDQLVKVFQREKSMSFYTVYFSIKLGCDMSSNLLKIAHQKGCTVFRADALELPIRDACFDAVISLAVIHHFSTLERRQRAIREILRVNF